MGYPKTLTRARWNFALCLSPSTNKREGIDLKWGAIFLGNRKGRQKAGVTAKKGIFQERENLRLSSSLEKKREGRGTFRMVCPKTVETFDEL